MLGGMSMVNSAKDEVRRMKDEANSFHPSSLILHPCSSRRDLRRGGFDDRRDGPRPHLDAEVPHELRPGAFGGRPPRLDLVRDRSRARRDGGIEELLLAAAAADARERTRVVDLAP